MSLIGAYSIDITPEIPVDLNGYILRYGRATGVHDPLSANILYIENGNKALLLVSLDILTIATDFADELRNKISEKLLLPKEAVLIAAIHTHSSVGGPYLRNGGQESEDWKSEFRRNLIDGCVVAKDSAKEAELYSYLSFSSVAVNRRKETRGIDPYAPFIVIKNGDTIKSMIINYNCHAVCLTEDNLKISPDYVYYLREYLYEKLNARFPILFFNGGSGDIDPKRRGSFDAAKYTGEKLGEEIYLSMQVYNGDKFIPEIVYYTEELEIPYNWRPTLKEAEKNLQEHDRLMLNAKTKEDKKITRAFYMWAQEIYELAQKNKIPSALTVKIYSIRFGKIIFIALPLEIFSSISLCLRKEFSKYNLFVISYANGYSGYLADKIAYYEGGYEVEQWHKYNGVLPLVPNAEDYFWEKFHSIKNKIK